MTHSFNDFIFKSKQILKDDIQFGDPLNKKFIICSLHHVNMPTK